ncbi:MAG: hypothetical protein JO159_06720 [Acidobacteria bacterium]|nr:hypothetical protein [Acidobacteriota bacterium]
MLLRTSALVCLSALLTSVAVAKDKRKITIPADVLNARTVLVVIKPHAGEPLTDPMANHRAQEDVEKALMKWGRFDIAQEASTADLVIAVRKGTGRSLAPTLSGGPIDQRPVIFEPQDGNVRVGGQRGSPPDITQPSGIPDRSPQIQTEVGSSDDSFEVYRGKIEYPLDSSPLWRYAGKDGLRSPDLPAVEQFRKVLDDAAKAANKNKQGP